MPPLPTLKRLYHADCEMARDWRQRRLAKIGRPLKEKTVLSHDVKVRLDDETYDRLLMYCGKNHEKATVIREALKAFLDTAGVPRREDKAE